MFSFILNHSKLTYEYVYSKEGFYDLLLCNGDTIFVDLQNGKLSLFFFLPYHPHFFLQKLFIDGKSVLPPKNQELVINGEFNATLKFKSNFYSKSQANLWILNKKICPNKSAFLYGAEEMEFNATSYSNLCIFSPIFDSKNKQFEIIFGSNSHFGSYFSFLYTKNVTIPFATNYGNKSNIYKINGSSFVRFKIIDSDEICYPQDLFLYSRKTKLKKTDNFENYCQMNYMSKCNSHNCHSHSSNKGKWSCSIPSN